MRYLLILDEHQYENFEKVDGNLLEIYAIDKDGTKHILDLRPIKTEMVVMPDGASIYITRDHIDAMIKFGIDDKVVPYIRDGWRYEENG